MSQKLYYTEGDRPCSQVGAALETLAGTIAQRREAGEESYTYRLLNGNVDKVLKKVMEEAGEVALAAKDASSVLPVQGESEFAAAAADAVYDNAVNHLRYEAADVVYHLLVVLERFGISMDEFAAELNARMTDDAIALRTGVALLKPEHINRRG